MVKGSALAEIAKEFAPASYIFSSADEEKAVESAKFYWERKSKKEQKIIIQYIDAKFDLWKLQHGIAPFSLFTILNPIKKTGDKEADRFLQIEKFDPWECLPPWINHTPLDLLYNMWVNDYWGLGYYEMLCGLAWLIIELSSKEQTHYRPAFVKYGLLLSEFRRKIAEETADELFVKHRKATKNQKNITSFNKEDEERKKVQRQSIWQHADTLISKGKAKREIIGIITNSGLHTNGRRSKIEDAPPTPLSKRHIRRELEEHPSGFWALRKK